jgi:regulatory protein
MSGEGGSGSKPDDGLRVEPDRLGHALRVAYASLNRRERTVGEVRRRLEGEGLAEAVVEQALATLIEDGYLDDARFARLFVEDKRSLQEWGRERIRRGLLDRGVEPELIEDALGQEEHSDLDRALALLSRRFPSPPRERRERDRALGVLIRKGYEPELALDALAAYARSG